MEIFKTLSVLGNYFTVVFIARCQFALCFWYVVGSLAPFLALYPTLGMPAPERIFLVE